MYNWLLQRSSNDVSLLWIDPINELTLNVYFSPEFAWEELEYPRKSDKHHRRKCGFEQSPTRQFWMQAPVANEVIGITISAWTLPANKMIGPGISGPCFWSKTGQDLKCNFRGKANKQKLLQDILEMPELYRNAVTF